MKKLLIPLLTACLLFSCSQAEGFFSAILEKLLPEAGGKSILIDGVNYIGGFYHDLYPQLSSSETIVSPDGVSYCRVHHPRFDLICLDQPGIDPLCCAEAQWQDAAAYYADNTNFTCHCQIGAQYTDRNPLFIQLDGMDAAMFDSLMAFAIENEYQPFGKNHSDGLLRMPEPDRDVSPQLIFYKESIDGLFTSFRGHKFHIINGQLFFVYYYDANYGLKDELVAIAVPDELSRYFVSLLEDVAI